MTATFAAAHHSRTASRAKVEVVAFLGKLVSVTGATARSLRDAGSPKITNGKRIADGLVRAIEQAKGLFEQALVKARRLPTSNKAAFKSAANNLGAELTAGSETVKRGLLDLKKLDTSGALSRLSSCG